MSNTDTTAQAEIRRLAQEWMDAVARRDADTLDHLMRDDFVLASGIGMFIESPNGSTWRCGASWLSRSGIPTCVCASTARSAR